MMIYFFITHVRVYIFREIEWVSYILMIALRSSETAVHLYRMAWHNIPQDINIRRRVINIHNDQIHGARILVKKLEFLSWLSLAFFATRRSKKTAWPLSLTRYVVLQCRQITTIICLATSQKCENLKYAAAEAWNLEHVCSLYYSKELGIKPVPSQMHPTHAISFYSSTVHSHD